MSINKFYEEYKKCVSGKFKFKFRKDILASDLPEKFTRVALQMCSSDKTISERDYYIYADFATIQHQVLVEKNVDLFELWAAITKAIPIQAGKQMHNTKKVYVSKERILQFERTELSEYFILEDLKIPEEGVTFYFDIKGEHQIFILRKEMRPEANENLPRRYRWVLLGLNTDRGTDFSFQTFINIGEQQSLNEVYKDTYSDVENLRDLSIKGIDSNQIAKEVIRRSKWLLPTVIKCLLYMQAVMVKPQNKSPHAISIMSSNACEKKKKKLLKGVPEFSIYDLSIINNTHYKNTGSKSLKNLRGHWVRGHFRKQVCGPNRSERKVIFIEPFFKGDADNPVERIYKL